MNNTYFLNAFHVLKHFIYIMSCKSLLLPYVVIIIILRIMNSDPESIINKKWLNRKYD